MVGHHWVGFVDRGYSRVMRVRQELRRDLTAPAAARRAISELDSDLGARAADVRVVVSELVTTAVTNSARAKQPVELRAAVEGDLVTVEVCEPVAETRAIKTTPRLDQHRNDGLSLSLVNALADAWGVRRADEHCLWAVFDRTRPLLAH